MKKKIIIIERDNLWIMVMNYAYNISKTGRIVYTLGNYYRRDTKL
jgi:hypothetical protein